MEPNDEAHNRISKAMSDYAFADLAWRQAVERLQKLEKERLKLHKIVQQILAETAHTEIEEKEE